MPLEHGMMRCVVFVTMHSGASYQPIGTAFLVSYLDKPLSDMEKPGMFCYFVTAAHVVRSREHDTFVRLRTKPNGIEEVPVPEWVCHPDPAFDVAVSLYLGPASYDIARMPMQDSVDQYQGPGKWQVELGDRVYFIGLLSQVQAMTDAGRPMVRSGTVGALYQEGLPIQLGTTVLRMRGHLMDCRAHVGFSGSPVFVQRDTYWPINRLVLDGQAQQGAGVAMGPVTLLFGLHSGHFSMWESTTSGLKVPVNSGVGIVTPVETIRATLQLEDLVNQRKRVVEEHLKKQQQTEQEAAAVADSITPNAPEFSKADFVEALKKASRRQSDQGTKGT
ncbi:MAG: S1 family peptidase [Gemmatimonadaceae bacterium]